MSTLLMPGPDGAEPEKTGDQLAQGADRRDGDGAGRDHHHQRRPEKPAIPSPDDCARAIAQVAGLVALGLLKPAQANAIRGSYREILQHHKNKAQANEKGPANVDVVELLRKSPEMLNLLEPLLTAEQINLVMKNAKDGDHGQA